MTPLLHSKVIGQGQPLLIMHGFLGMSDNWKTLGTKYAQKGYQVHLIDHRNHGKSFHHNDFSYQDMISDLIHYINHYQLENILLLGHSMGGKVAMFLATEYSALIDKLVVVDISPKYYPAHHQDVLQGLKALYDTEIQSRSHADEILQPYVSEVSTRQFLMKNITRSSDNKLVLKLNLPSILNYADEIGKALDDNSIFNNPTLFIAGGVSNYISEEDVILIKNHFPYSEIKKIPSANHWVHATNPNELFKMTLSFFF